MEIDIDMTKGINVALERHRNKYGTCTVMEIHANISRYIDI